MQKIGLNQGVLTMPNRKRANKSKKTSKNHKQSESKAKTSNIPVLTKKASDEKAATSTQNAAAQQTNSSIDYNNEIRTLVTIAVNESVPQMVETIMAKLMQPIGTDPNSE